MSRLISLAHLSAIDLPPHELIEVAATAGFDAVGLRLIRVTETSPGYPLMSDTAMMRATMAALRNTGICVNDIEFVKIEPATDIASLAHFLDAGAELGAKEVICAPYDLELNRLAENLGRLSDLAQNRGLGVSLEFFPWTAVPHISAAEEIVRQAGPQVGILVDALHFDRSASTIKQLQGVPRDRLRLAHICDAPVDGAYGTADLLHTAREERLPPGEGQIDLARLIENLPSDLTLGVEVPMTEATRNLGEENIISILKSKTREFLKELNNHW